MLVVTVELWPGGDPIHAKEIASVQIANMSNLADTSDYIVEAQGEAWGEIPASTTRFIVVGHPRRLGVFELLKTVFNKLGEK